LVRGPPIERKLRVVIMFPRCRLHRPRHARRDEFDAFAEDMLRGVARPRVIGRASSRSRGRTGMSAEKTWKFPRESMVSVAESFSPRQATGHLTAPRRGSRLGHVPPRRCLRPTEPRLFYGTAIPITRRGCRIPVLGFIHIVVVVRARIPTGPAIVFILRHIARPGDLYGLRRGCSNTFGSIVNLAHR